VAKRTVPEQYLAIAALYPKWQRAIAAARRAIADVEAGSGDLNPLFRAKDRLYKLIDEAAGHAPLGYQDPAVTSLYAEIEALPKPSEVEERGRQARERAQRGEIKRLREEERELRRPNEWMRR
jgi:hypothetical protein